MAGSLTTAPGAVINGRIIIDGGTVLLDDSTVMGKIEAVGQPLSYLHISAYGTTLESAVGITGPGDVALVDCTLSDDLSVSGADEVIIDDTVVDADIDLSTTYEPDSPQPKIDFWSCLPNAI